MQWERRKREGGRGASMWGVAAGYSETRGNLSLPEESRQTGCVCWEWGGGKKGGRGSQADVKRKQIVLRLLFSSLLLLFFPLLSGLPVQVFLRGGGRVGAQFVSPEKA